MRTPPELMAVVGKLKEESESLAPGIKAVPERVTACGELAALSAKLSLAVSVPAAVGLKVTVMVQDAPALMVPQLLFWRKEEAFAPPVTMLVRTRAEPPELVRVKVSGAEDAPITVEGKVRLEGAKLATGAATAVPLRATGCGELTALPVKVREAAAAPAAVGLKVTEMVQEALAASVVAQLLVRLKAAALAPVRAILLIVSEAFPELVRVTVCAAEAAPTVVAAKVRLAGESVAPGPEGVPVPLRATDCGELGAVSVKVREAAAAPAAVGLKVTVTEQEALAARVAPHVFVCLKGVVVAVPEDVFALVMVMPEMVRALEPELVRVTVCAVDVALTRVEAKVRLAGEMVAAGPEVEAAGQPLTTLATLSEPRPVALS